MEREDLTIEWKWDDDADLSWMDEEERKQAHEVYGCVVTAPDGTVESLWGITDPDRAYMREIEAELVSELLYRIAPTPSHWEAL